MKSNNLWIVSLKVMMMSAFCSIISFMLNCLVVAVASNNFAAGDAVWTRIIIQLMGLVVQFIFIYGTLWDCGETDRQKINLRLGKYSEYRGALIGLIAAIPYYFMAIAMMLMTFKYLPDITGLLRVCSSQFWGIYTFLLPVATGSNPGTGPVFAQSVATPVQAFCACFVPTIIPILSIIPYRMGRKGIIFGEKLIFVNRKKKK